MSRTGWKSSHLVEAHPQESDWESCKACLAPVLVELTSSQMADKEAGVSESDRTVEIKQRWSALFWRARTWCSRRKHMATCMRQTEHTRSMAQALLDANADSNRKAAAQREERRRKDRPDAPAKTRRRKTTTAATPAIVITQDTRSSSVHLGIEYPTSRDGFESDYSPVSSQSQSLPIQRQSQTYPSVLASSDSVALNSDLGEDGGASMASDYDFDLEDELEYPVAEEPAFKKAKVGRVRKAQTANKRALDAAGKGKSLPAWHSSHLVSKHPIRNNLETCSACLSSYMQERIYVQRDNSLSTEQKEIRLEEVERLIEESYWNSKRVYARNRHLHQCALQTSETQEKAASRYNSHLERHRVYSKNWAERTKPVSRGSLSVVEGDDGESSVTDGDYGDDSYYAYDGSEGYDDSYSAGYSFDALTAAAQEAANGSSFDDAYSTGSGAEGSARREGSEELLPLTPNEGGFTSTDTKNEDGDYMLPHSFIPSAVWEILEFEEQLVKGAAQVPSHGTNQPNKDEANSYHQEISVAWPNFAVRSQYYQEPQSLSDAKATMLSMFGEGRAIQV